MKIDKLSKQVERISTQRGTIKDLMTTATPGRCGRVIEEIVDVLPMCHIVKLVN
jgi:hypothetical protein